jgi:glyoxylase-like metal-dependent hydrolase (beta-lactamase superfamily II)
MIKAFSFENNAKEFSANTFVLGKVGEPCIVIDLGNTGDEVEKYIKDSHMGKLLAVLLTHGHFDHIRGLSKLLDTFGEKTPVYMNKADEDLLADPEKNCSLGFSSSPIMADLNPIFVKDGEILTLGENKLKVIFTPFHTLGSVCYFSKEDNALFTGDTLFKDSIGRTDVPTSDPNLVNESLKKLLALPDMLVCYPGHGAVTKLGYEKRNNPYLKNLIEKKV